ncbi:MAG TPA: fibronectin type III domain-containing protein, partial [Candidatus Thermoplasmatota archaeon]|nr:fibronectin type III domain-containing protein [Candidatus Thermoplasmatota archaeon]
GPQQAEVKDLEHGHVYRFRTLALDKAGNLEELGLKAAYNTTLVDLEAPQVRDVQVREITTRSALFTWTTTEPTNGSVTLTALDGPRAGSKLTAREPGTAREDHRVFMTGLLPGTTYRVALGSKDAAGNLNFVPAEGDAVFKTIHLLRAGFQYPTARVTLSDVATLRWSGAHADGANVTYTLTLVDTDGKPLAGRDQPLHTLTVAEGPLDGYHAVDVDTLLTGDCHQCRLRLVAETSEERFTTLSPAFDIDNLPPTVTLGTDGLALGASGWYNATLKVALLGEDAGAGVKAIYYATGGANVYDRFERKEYTGPFTLPDGLHTLRFYAEDKAGRESPLQERLLRVDTAAPVISEFSTAATRLATSEALLRVEATDGGSGLKDLRLRVNGGPWSAWEAYRPTVQLAIPGPDGLKSIEVEVRDVAGNPSVGRVLTLTLDTTPPGLTDLGVTTIPGEATLTWRTDEPTRGEVRLVGKDGVATRATSGALGLKHTVTFRDLVPGMVYDFELRLTDEAGLKGALVTRSFTLDKDNLPPGPVKSLAASVRDGRVVLTWAPAVDNVGVLKYRVAREAGDGAPRVGLADTPALSFIDLGAPGASLRYYVSAVDAAGNEGPSSRVILAAPGSGGFESTSITPERTFAGSPVTFEATYRPEAGSPAPASVVLVLGENRYAMVASGETDTGALRYTLTLSLPALNLSATRAGYHLEALTTEATLRYPALGELPGPVVTAPLATSEGEVEGESFFARVPGPALLVTLAAFMMGAVGWAWFRGRPPRRILK